MTWAKLDDHFPFHRKIRPISDAAFRLHVSAICWCCEHLTDGHVEHDEVALCSDVKKPAAAVAELVKRGLWHETDTGWVIHDFLTYNGSRASMVAAREKEARRKKDWRDRKDAETSVPPPVPVSVPVGHDVGHERLVDRPSDYPDPTRPDPTRPVPSLSSKSSADAADAAPHRSPKSRSTPCPDIFPVTDTMRAWTLEHAPWADTELETARFLAHHRSKDSRFVRWDQAWRTWMGGVRKPVQREATPGWAMWEN